MLSHSHNRTNKKDDNKRYHENAEGDFYVIKDACTSCGAPEAEGKGLIEHSKKDISGQCYFKRQPVTDEEIENAINAIRVSCIEALRYGGKDEDILRKMYELGLRGLCDNTPVGNYDIVVRNVVTFCSTENTATIANNVTRSLVDQYHKVIDLYYNDAIFTFTLRNTFAFRDIHFKGEQLYMQSFKIILNTATGSEDASLIHLSESLYIILKDKVLATNIQWFKGEDVNGVGASRPTFI